MKLLPVFLFPLYLTSASAQTLPNLDEIKLNKPADYKAAEAIVNQAATYLVSNPFDNDDINRTKSLQFVIKWMSGTPDYSFTLDDVATKITKGNNDLLGLYMACMTKYSIENKVSSTDAARVKLNAIRMLLAYCENPVNNLKMNKPLKKLSEANKKGELEKEL